LLVPVRVKRFKFPCRTLRGSKVTYFEQDTDAKVHERFGEIDHTFPGIVDGHGADGQVGFLDNKVK
jgi:hypothetical protein